MEQLEAVIEKIREKDKQTMDLANVLDGFNDTFKHFLGQLENTFEIKGLQEATHSLLALNQRIEHIEEKLKKVDEQQERRLEELGDQLEGYFQKTYSSSSFAVELEDTLYVMTNSGKGVWAYGEGDSRQIVYEGQEKIKSLISYKQHILLYLENGKLMDLKSKTCLLEDASELKISGKGLIYLTAQGELYLYQWHQKKSRFLIREISHFELLEGHYLMCRQIKTEQDLLGDLALIVRSSLIDETLFTAL